MTTKPPHNFPSLTDPQSQSKPVLLIGAGMSAGIAPMPPQFVRELAPRQRELEVRLGCSAQGITIDPGNAQTLYQWAGQIINELLQNKKSLSEAKKELADALGITTDPRWRGRTTIPLRGNTPRHRVTARLAREGRWKALWSLNWDCVLETTLESVGMPAHPGTIQKKKLPWVEWHQTWTQPNPLPPSDDDSTVLVVKAHGCAGKLANGDSSTFLITSDELNKVGESLEQSQHKGPLMSHFSLHPLLTCGWSASENYLLNWFEELSGSSSIPAHVLDPLSIIDLKPNSGGHIRMISAYKVIPPEQAQFKVLESTCHTTDDLFIWIQTRFGLNHLKQLHNAPVVELEALLTQVASPACGHWLNDWFDSFLPVWVRLCFNAEVTKFFVNAGPVAFEAIPTDLRDDHIPWGYQQVQRPDLIMATTLLLTLAENNVGERWDAARFPGGLWDLQTRQLVLPLPCPQAGQLPDLASLKAMVESHHWERQGDIMSLDILPLDQTGLATPPPEIAEALKMSVSKLMKHLKLADYKNIGIVDFSALKGA